MDEVEMEKGASSLLNGLKGPFGKGLLMFYDAQTLAHMCRANLDLETWFKVSSGDSESISRLWYEVKARIDALNAQEAIDMVLACNTSKLNTPANSGLLSS